jgi:hypothetical protein
MKRSFLGVNVNFGNNETETIIKKSCEEKVVKTSENICDASRREEDSSHYSNKQIRSISYSDIYSFSTSNHYDQRRSTLTSTTLNNRNKYLTKTISHQSINITKENSLSQLFQNDIERGTTTTTTTTIKLSLPVRSSGLNPSRRHKLGHQHSIQGEFTLPTNPPITVTIQPQSNLILNNPKENSFHDDQICPPERVNILNEQRISLDPSLKGASTIVNYFMDLLKPSDNKLAMKLFGSRKGVLKERLRQQRSGHCIIHPCSNFR